MPGQAGHDGSENLRCPIRPGMTGLIFGAEKLFEALAVVDFLGFVEGFPEGNGTAVLGDFFEPRSPAVGEHEVRLRDPQFLLFLSRFHRHQRVSIIIDAKCVSFVSRNYRNFATI